MTNNTEQGPVAWSQQRKRNLIKHWALDCGWEDLTEREIDDLELIINAVLNAAPVRTKDLTDAEIHEIKGYNETREMYDFAHAVIRAYKEKQK